MCPRQRVFGGGIPVVGVGDGFWRNMHICCEVKAQSTAIILFPIGTSAIAQLHHPASASRSTSARCMSTTICATMRTGPAGKLPGPAPAPSAVRSVLLPLYAWAYARSALAGRLDRRLDCEVKANE